MSDKPRRERRERSDRKISARAVIEKACFCVSFLYSGSRSVLPFLLSGKINKIFVQNQCLSAEVKKISFTRRAALKNIESRPTGEVPFLRARNQAVRTNHRGNNVGG